MTVRSEIDFIKAYNKVQKIRYPNAFYLVYDVEEEIMEEPDSAPDYPELCGKQYEIRPESRYRDRDSCDCAKRRGETSDLRLRQRQRQ